MGKGSCLSLRVFRAEAMTAPREPVDLEAIEARVNAATPGPWESVTVMPSTDSGSGSWAESPWRLVNGPPQVIQDEMLSRRAFRQKADADFIAHARTDIPSLLTENRALREALANARAYIPRGPSVDDADLLADIDALLGERG